MAPMAVAAPLAPPLLFSSRSSPSALPVTLLQAAGQSSSRVVQSYSLVVAPGATCNFLFCMSRSFPAVVGETLESSQWCRLMQSGSTSQSFKFGAEGGFSFSLPEGNWWIGASLITSPASAECSVNLTLTGQICPSSETFGPDCQPSTNYPVVLPTGPVSVPKGKSLFWAKKVPFDGYMSARVVLQNPINASFRMGRNELPDGTGADAWTQAQTALGGASRMSAMLEYQSVSEGDIIFGGLLNPDSNVTVSQADFNFTACPLPNMSPRCEFPVSTLVVASGKSSQSFPLHVAENQPSCDSSACYFAMRAREGKSLNVQFDLSEPLQILPIQIKAGSAPTDSVFDVQLAPSNTLVWSTGVLSAPLSGRDLVVIRVPLKSIGTSMDLTVHMTFADQPHFFGGSPTQQNGSLTMGQVAAIIVGAGAAVILVCLSLFLALRARRRQYNSL